MKPQATPARRAALECLIDARKRGIYETVYIHDFKFDDEREHAYAVKLVRGVASYKLCLDYLIDFYARKISPSVRDALRISTYELLYLEKEPAVVIDQGVELVKSVAKAASGLANAVLHKIANEELPTESWKRLGYPKWLYERLANVLDFDSFAKLSDMEPETSYVPTFGNTLAEGESVIDAAAAGKVIICDKASQEVAQIVAENSGEKFLEIGAGRGTKTALIHQYKNHFDRYDVLDNSNFRLDSLRDKAKLLDFHVDYIYCEDATSFNNGFKYDTIFIDTPCSGLGTLRRHPEIKSRLTREDIAHFAAIDLKILKNAANLLADGGSIYYATCTVAPEENEGILKVFGKPYEVLREATLTEDSDAHFLAKITL